LKHEHSINLKIHLWVEVQNFGYAHKGINDDLKQRVSVSQYDDE
jgi:hypothetical protein